MMFLSAVWGGTMGLEKEVLIPGSGPRFVRPGNKNKKRWSYNTDILHPDGNIYALDRVFYEDGSTELIIK